MSLIFETILGRVVSRKMGSFLLAAAFAVAAMAPKRAQAELAFVVQNDTLYGVYSGDSRRVVSTGWTGATSIAYRTNVHIVQNSRLYRVDPPSGARTQLGNAEWGGPTEMTWNHAINKLFIVQNDHLQRIDDPDFSDTGSYAVLGGAIWSGTTSMTSIADSLYIIRSGNLYRVNPTTGSRSIVGTAGDWSGATRMVAQQFTTQSAPIYLYVIQNSRLHRVDPANGSYTVLGSPEWGGATSMGCYFPGSALFSSLLVIQNSRLHNVNPDGSYQVLGSPIWSGSTLMASGQCGAL
jgi:hypothetical protein